LQDVEGAYAATRNCDTAGRLPPGEPNPSHSSAPERLAGNRLAVHCDSHHPGQKVRPSGTQLQWVLAGGSPGPLSAESCQLYCSNGPEIKQLQPERAGWSATALDLPKDQLPAMLCGQAAQLHTDPCAVAESGGVRLPGAIGSAPAAADPEPEEAPDRPRTSAVDL